MIAFSLKKRLMRHFIYREISSKINSIECGEFILSFFVEKTMNDEMSVEIDWRTMKCMQRNC